MPPLPHIIAHRGASAEAPENTLAAFELAFAQGADGIETDVHLSADGQIVCIHDESTGRTASRDLTIAASTLDELRALDVGKWKAARFTGQRIPTLAQVLAIIPPGKFCFIEIKSGPGLLGHLRTALGASRVPPSALRILSFDAETIALARRELPAIKAHWLVEWSADAHGLTSPSFDDILRTLTEIRADGLGPETTIEHLPLIAKLAPALRECNLELAPWTIDDPAVARAIREMGAWSLTTNHPAPLRRGIAGKA